MVGRQQKQLRPSFARRIRECPNRRYSHDSSWLSNPVVVFLEDDHSTRSETSLSRLCSRCKCFLNTTLIHFHVINEFCIFKATRGVTQLRSSIPTRRARPFDTAPRRIDLYAQSSPEHTQIGL